MMIAMPRKCLVCDAALTSGTFYSRIGRALFCDVCLVKELYQDLRDNREKGMIPMMTQEIEDTIAELNAFDGEGESVLPIINKRFKGEVSTVPWIIYTDKDVTFIRTHQGDWEHLPWAPAR